jgi:hypothetical protein
MHARHHLESVGASQSYAAALHHLKWYRMSVDGQIVNSALLLCTEGSPESIILFPQLAYS